MATNLQNGCSYTEVWVSPKNWKSISEKKGLEENWYVQCKFYDPNFKEKYPNGFPYRKKLNKFKTVAERKNAVKFLLSEIPILFEENNYNPITKKYMSETLSKDGFSKDMFITDAFLLAQKFLTNKSDTYLSQVRIIVNRFIRTLNNSNQEYLTLKELNYSTFSSVFEKMELKPSYYNKSRVYFSSVFKILIKNECVSSDFASMIEKKRVTQKIRKSLTTGELLQIFNYLDEFHSDFGRFCWVFFYSGTRFTELLSIQAKHVRLSEQEYDVLIKKRKGNYAWETKVILINSLEYWRSILDKCTSPDDYLFSYKLLPGTIKNNEKQLAKRWKTHVKDKLAFYNDGLFLIDDLERNNIKDYRIIEEDLYSIKHTFLDKLDEKQSKSELKDNSVLSFISSLNLDISVQDMILAKMKGPTFDVAQSMAAHQSSDITNKVYKVNKKKRENEYLKGLRL